MARERKYRDCHLGYVTDTFRSLRDGIVVITKILGGFGNQLNAFAWGYSLARYTGQELVLDISDYVQKGYVRPYALDKLQIGDYRKLTYPDASADFLGESCIPEKILEQGFRIITQEKVKTREELLAAAEGAQNIYLLGYGGIQYTSEKECMELVGRFQLKEQSSAVEQFRARIAGEYSVAVHIRRTDFVDLNAQTSKEFFQAAIVYIRLFYPQAQFYFFSDDIAYAKGEFGRRENYHYVRLLGGADADLDEFFCMASCNSRILSSGSTFSFWASRLSQSENKMDLEMRNGNNTEQMGGMVYLNKAAVENLSKQYQLTEQCAGQALFDDSQMEDIVYRLVEGGHNDEAISAIDNVCMDISLISDRTMRYLSDLKAVALAQKGREMAAAAQRHFYDKMQSDYKDSYFHGNYFRTLYYADHVWESAIHAAMANRYGDTEDYGAYFEEKRNTILPAELYRQIKSSVPRHYIFVPIEGWSYYISYVKTIAVLLARMGQRVTFFPEKWICSSPPGCR